MCAEVFSLDGRVRIGLTGSRDPVAS